MANLFNHSNRFKKATRPVPDFSKLQQGTDYLTFQKDGVSKNVLMKDVREAGLDINAPNYVPPSMRNGEYGTITAYNAKRKHSPTASHQSLPNKAPYSPTPYIPQSKPVGSYAEAVMAKPKLQQGGGDQYNPKQYRNSQHQSQRPPYTPTTPTSSMIRLVKPSYEDLVKQVRLLEKIIKDDSSGIDAIILRLGDVESDISHSSGVKKAIEKIKEELEELRQNKILVTVDGETASILDARLLAGSERDDMQDHRIEVLIAISQLLQEQVHSLQVANARNMASYLIDNVVIGGVRQFPNEDCREAAAGFFHQVMGIRPQQHDIIYAERMGLEIVKGNQTFPPCLK